MDQHFEGCPQDHGDHPCTPIDWAMQARLDANPELMAQLQSSLTQPRVQRPRRVTRNEAG